MSEAPELRTEAVAEVVSLAARLKRRREELGLSQAQAARELDVARTAYRLWELEAAKPQPDRWRLISRWLGVSVTTMLLSDELEGDPSLNEGLVSDAFDRVGREWDAALSTPSEYFAQAHKLIQEGAANGFIATAHAEELKALFHGIQQEYVGAATELWEPARMYKELRAGAEAPRAARDAVTFVGSDLPESAVEDARLLTTELVSNSVTHGYKDANATVGLLIDINRERLRVEVTDLGSEAPRLAEPHETGGYGLSLVDQLATRWDTTRTDDSNVTWFEIDLPTPGAQPQRR